jgi:aminoglycoside phosphotransferase (APT) family kinase protein
VNVASPQPVISKGGTSDLFAWSGNRVLKVLHARYPRSKAELEFQITRAIHGAGLPAPAAYEVHEFNGRFGFILDRIDGISLLQLVERQPWKLFYAARLLAELHAQTHQHSAPTELPTQREQLEDWLARADDFTPAERGAAETSLAQLPAGNNLCHGDFHPGNILLSHRGPVIIDWSTATRGHPPADVARTSVLFESAALPPGSPIHTRILLFLARRLLHRTYLRRYLTLRGGTIADITKFLPIQRAATSAWRCTLPD